MAGIEQQDAVVTILAGKLEEIPGTLDGYACLARFELYGTDLGICRCHVEAVAISEARAHGDLSENAEYHAAKEQQGLKEAHAAELEDKIGRALDGKVKGDSVEVTTPKGSRSFEVLKVEWR